MSSGSPNNVGEQARRQRTLKLALVVGLSAVLAIVVLIVISRSGDSSGDAEIETTAAGELAGLAQRGDEIGDPTAAVTVSEFGDLQCPVCAQFSSTVVPELLAGPVSDGRAKMRFRNWVILGPDSETAAKAALAAGEQDGLWDYVELFYENQGREGSGYVTDEFLRGIAEGAGLDVGAWEDALGDEAFDDVLAETDAEAQALGFSGTPSVLVEGPGGQFPLGGVPSAGQVEDAISQAAG